MQIVPVIDLKGGVVVRARHGERAPIFRSKRRSADSEPATCRRAYALHAFKALYVADLDAIESAAIMRGLLPSCPKITQLSLWVDNAGGDRSGERLLARCARPRW